ncbi:hypothetical protein O6270_24005, partial [Salmonella enterica subsp. enterica]
MLNEIVCNRIVVNEIVTAKEQEDITYAYIIINGIPYPVCALTTYVYQLNTIFGEDDIIKLHLRKKYRLTTYDSNNRVIEQVMN